MGGRMAQSPLPAQFHGTVALATLHLRRLAKSNDVEAGFAAARELGMLDDEREQFMRACFELDARLAAGEAQPEELSYDQTAQLQRCILSINSADPA